MAAGYFAWESGWLAAQLLPISVVLRGGEMCSAEEVLQEAGLSGGVSLPSYWYRLWRFQPSSSRWLKDLTLQPSIGRQAVLLVQERRPLAAVHCGPLRGWLCDDGVIVPALPDDKSERFTRIAALPPVVFPAAALAVDTGGQRLCAQRLDDADATMAVLAACALDLPGQVKAVQVAADRHTSLLCNDGLEVRLGSAENLQVKLAALPKALRLCAESRDKLRYLDASDSGVFYQKWKQAPTLQPSEPRI
jgi:hypothetical protein